MKRIITIGREFGSGGSDLGRRLARELGIPYYDRDIILRTAKASAHLTPEQVRQWDERVPMEFGFTQSLFNFLEVTFVSGYSRVPEPPARVVCQSR